MGGAAALRTSIQLKNLGDRQVYYALAIHRGEIEGNGSDVNEKKHSERSCLMISYNCT